MKIAVLTGAGISAESGIRTFRDANGLWEGHDVMEVASPEGWTKNRNLVLNFYNERREQLKSVKPNRGHLSLKELEEKHEVVIVTQNVDNLHELARSSNIIHLHGELNKVRSTINPNLVYNWKKDLNLGDMCEEGHQLRPHIVWFGEAVPMLETAIVEVENADSLIIIGTSLQVYPAASLAAYVKPDCEIYYIDPAPALNYELTNSKNLTVLKGPATIKVPELVTKLKKG